MIAQINEDYLLGIQLWMTIVTKRIDTPLRCEREKDWFTNDSCGSCD